MKSLLLIGVLALSSLSVAGAKTYHFTLDSSAKAGAVMLTPGDYKVKVEGSNAVFTNIRTAKTFTTSVKIETADKKHDNTAVEMGVKNGTQQIQTIKLGGST